MEGVNKGKKKAQPEAPTRIIGRHVGSGGAEEEEGNTNPSIATLWGAKIQSQPIWVSRNCVRGGRSRVSIGS